MPKIIGRSLEEHRREVRSRVFDVLRGQLYERGFDAITLAGVAAEAGLGRTAMYNHFPDKESLLVAFVEDEATRYVERLKAAVATADTPVEKLSTFVRLQLRVLAEYHLPPGTALASALAPAAYRRISAHADPITGQLREILAEGVPEEDPELLIPMITAALGSRQVVDVPPERLDDAIEGAVRFVLRAVGMRDDREKPEN
ncbi:TetR/AcrR family transcriptional regulator [Amycolatopsis regifaucium]|uniref:TetR family transcriptional regulator n=1 Tax=Amycolatopsis regifaucium TaxID=546365 RepID=A0A154MSH7_9PSEU|nr:TetR/AcrR family transcriptional regulator [Amycolatopsis regifaucium]KZB87278.1 TetR family transcriptional regulator [Amycolatopsis regifaucium]OKA08112.1 TetR family transcriptional regulator [Amycolatopsis regifaucium]SFI40012.1 DNA-binding transcriptional regulator, AcrR family [Amycolatopsis regifaucium]